MAGKGGRRSTTWGPGQGGRKPDPPEIKDIREAAQQHSKEALERLLFWMRSDHATASPMAVQVMLDRAFGKARQSVEMSGPNGGPIQTQDVTDDRDDLAAILARVREARKETRH